MLVIWGIVTWRVLNWGIVMWRVLNWGIVMWRVLNLVGHSRATTVWNYSTYYKNGISWRKPFMLHHSVKPYLKQVFQSVYRNELEIKLSQKLWKQELAKIPDWARTKAVRDFRLCIWHDCLGTHLHCTEIHPDPYCMLCSLHETTDRNHLAQCTALCNVSDTGRPGQKWWKADLVPSLLLSLWLLLIVVTFIVTVKVVYVFSHFNALFIVSI